jgi:hypothetical protein
MSEEVRDAVFGNVGTMITFRVGASDAPLLAKEYIPVFEETDLINLDKYHIYVKMSIDGVTTIPFSATNVPPYTEVTNNHDKVIEQSRQKYGQPRELVEENIRKNNISAVEKLLQSREAGSGLARQPAISQKPQIGKPFLRSANSGATEGSRPPAGWQEVTDTNGQRFYVLYHEDETKSEIRQSKPDLASRENPKSETNLNVQNPNDEKMADIRKTIDEMKTDQDGQTIIEAGETHEIKRDEKSEAQNPKSLPAMPEA